MDVPVWLQAFVLITIALTGILADKYPNPKGL